MTNVYLVESPLQLLSAIEAKASFPLTESIIIVRNSSTVKNNQQMEIVRNLTTWSEIIIIKTFFYTFDSDIQLIHLLRRLQSRKLDIDNLFVGEYRSWVHRLFHKNLACKHIYLLDDGAAIINVQKNLIAMGKEYPYINKMKLLLLQIWSAAHGLHWKTVAIPNLFTCFDLMPVSAQMIKKNTFGFVRQLLDKKPVEPNEIFFFGSTLSNPLSPVNGIISRDDEIAYIQKISTYFRTKGKMLVYIPHRGEDSAKLDRIRQECGLRVKNFVLPAEIELMNITSMPEGIASFYSTALFTVSRLHPFSSVEAFRMPSSAINPVYAESINSVYNEYANAFRVIDIDDIN